MSGPKLEEWDSCSCAECGERMLKAAAVVMNGQTYHPIGCFDKALGRLRRAVDESLTKNLGGFSLSIEMESVSPEVARHLGELAENVVRAHKARR